MIKIIRIVVSIINGAVKTGFLRLARGKNVKFGKLIRCHGGSEIRVYKASSLSVADNVSLGQRTIISVLNGGSLRIGENVGINSDCKVVCHDNISIGKNTIFAPSVYVYDHDHIFKKESGVEHRRFRTAPIEIGENCWIGAQTVILKGTKIGNNCLIAAGSVVKGNVPDNTLFVQKRENCFKEI